MLKVVILWSRECGLDMLLDRELCMPTTLLPKPLHVILNHGDIYLGCGTFGVHKCILKQKHLCLEKLKMT